MESSYEQIKFTDADMVDRDDYIPDGEYNPYCVRPWLIHDHGFCVCVVFASNLRDALDKAVDAYELDKWMIDPSDDGDRVDYMVRDVCPPSSGYDPDVPEYVHTDGTKWWWKSGYEPTCLGNAGEPFDIEALDVMELPNPKWSFCAMFNAAQSEKGVKS